MAPVKGGLWFVAVLAVLLLGDSTSAHAAVTCSLSGDQLRVDMSADNDSLVLTRAGAALALRTDNDYTPPLQPQIACAGGSPTVDNTNSVSLTQAADTEDQVVALDLRNGPFAPGATPEADGGSEIEISLELHGDSDVYVEGSDGPDAFSASVADPTHFGIDLSAVGAPEVGEPDVRLAPVKDIILLGEGGADSINVSAVPYVVSRHVAAVFTLGGRSGDDQLISGGLQSNVNGGDGRDLLVGSTGPDILSGGSASDRIIGGRGKDSVDSVDGKRDRISCGANRDNVEADRRDKAKRCERITRTRKRRLPDLPEPSFPALL
jgi:hypothetical protein